jgi:hypothetical protein
MRQATWLKLEASPFWNNLYRQYRRLPDSVRSPLRTTLMPHWQLARWLVLATSLQRVVAGPFTGTRLDLSPLSQRQLLGYILGTQELELHDVMEQIIARQYGAILNIGAADGYYAVGLAVRSPRTQVAAFEMLAELHPIIVRTARANRVEERVSVHGKCDLSAFRTVLQTASHPILVLMDVEGGELALLDPLEATELEDVDILVETHDMFAPGCTETLTRRFQPTHNIERRTTRARVLADFPPNFLRRYRRIFPQLAIDLMDERRPSQQHWLYMTAKR